MNKTITKEQIESCFGHPLYEACIMLGIESKDLKPLLKQYGINRWPKTRIKNKSSDPFQTFHLNKTKSLSKISDYQRKEMLPSAQKNQSGRISGKISFERDSYVLNQGKDVKTVQDVLLQPRETKPKNIMDISNLCN
eukprot:gene1726-495_t